jgi:SAM-dependent methyltransferase
MSEVRHPIFARLYARLSVGMESAGVADDRRSLLAGVSGRVVEVGAGNGLNFAHYPTTVTEVVAIEPEPYLRARAATAAADAPVPVRVEDAVADALPVPDDSVDVAVCSLVLCSVPDQARALAEIRRVLRPGGELRFFEHVRAPGGAFAAVQRGVDVIWPHLAGGCHTSRDTVGAIEAAGFAVERLDRFRFPDSRVPNPAAPHALGLARATG